MNKNESNEVVAGVDVASEEHVMRISVDSKVRRYPNNLKGCLRLLRDCQASGVKLVVLEHTGRHERALLEVLWNASVAVHCAHPKSVHNFGKVLRANAKSDPLDAGVLMEYGLAIKLAPTPRPAQEVRDLQEIASRRAELNEMLVQEKNRLHTPSLPSWKKKSYQKIIRMLERELETLGEQMELLTEAHQSLSAPIAELCKEHGIGFISAATFYAHIPELGTVNRQRIAALVGVAPFIRQSGKWKGQAKIYGGRTAARCALYMPALALLRKKGHPLREFYQRLKKQNKTNNEALTAVMRKLAIRLNTRLKMLRLGQPLAN